MGKLTIKKDRNVRQAFKNVFGYFKREFELADRQVINILKEEYILAVKAAGASEKEAISPH